MSNYIYELAIAIKVRTEGVVKGIETAISHTKRYQKQIQALQEEIKLKFDESGINQLKNAINDLNKRKEELQKSLKINVNSSEISRLRNEINGIDLKMKDIKINVEDEQAKQKLKELENKKLDLQKEINSKVKVDSEQAKQRLKDLRNEINNININIKDIKININDEQAKQKLKELENKKLALQKEINSKVKVDSEQAEQKLKNLKNEINSINSQIKCVKINVEDEQAKQKLKELENKKLALQKEINSKIKLDLENKEKIQKELIEIDKNVKNLERNIVIKLEESGINSAKTELNSLNEKLKETENINKNLDGSFLALGVTATAVFAGIVTSVNKGIEAYTQYTNAISGLRSQMEYVGEDMGKATQMIKDLTKDGLISESDVAMSIKNLTLYGYSLEEANQIILRLKDSAAYNRQAHYDLGEAVRVTTEGIRNENSVLSDAAGVTKNIAKMYEEYAKSLGKSTDSLTQAEKQQAVLNGVLVETEAMVGNAIIYSEQLGGVMAKEEAQVKRLAQAYGSALEPSIKELKSHLNSLLEEFTNFINENQELVAGATTSASSLMLMGTSVIALKKGVPIIKNLINGFKQGTVAVKGFNASLGTVGLVLTGISVAIGIFTSIKTSIEKAKEEQKALNEEVEKFNTLMIEATTEKNINLKTTELDNLKQAKKDMEEIANYFENNSISSLTTGMSLEKSQFDRIFKEKLGKTEEDLNNFKASLKKCGIEFDNLFNEFGEFDINLNAFNALDEKIKELIIDVNGFSESLEFNVSLNGISNTLNSLNSLSGACDKLIAGEKLTNEELSKLIAQYPIIAEYIANTGDLSLNKGEIARQVVDEEIEAQKRAMEIEQQRIDKAIDETKKLIETKNQLNETQTGDMFDKTAQEIANLEERLKEYEEQNLSAKASITILNDEMAKMGNEKMLSGLRGMQTEVANLEKAYETLANSEQLSYEQVKQLIDIYPELQQYIAKTGDVTFNSGEVILQVIGNVKQAYNEKRASLIENSKAEIKAIQEEVKAITTAYEQERLSIIDLMKARQKVYRNGTNFIGPLTDKQVVDEYVNLNNKKIKELENSIKEIELIGNIANNASKKTIGISSNNKSSASSIKEQTTELEKQLEIYNKLNETTEMSSKEQLKHLESLKSIYAKTTEDFDQINKLIYSARKQANDDWYSEEIKAIQKLNKGREDNTDFQGIINEYKNLIEEVKTVYTDYPETLKKLTDDLNNYIIEATNSRSQKLYNIETENLNNTISKYEEHINLLKKLDGLEIGGETFNFTIQDETSILKNILNEINLKLNEFATEKGTIIKNMSDDEKAYYENLLSLQKSYNDKYIDSNINVLKEIQENEKKVNEERLKNLEKTLKEQSNLAKENSKEYINAIKEKYDKEIELAKNTANQEIAIYEQKIKEIDDILKQDQRDERDEDILDKIKRAEESLKYETNEVNKYELQKEIAKLKEEYEKNQKKDKLEDEKENLQEQINSLKENNNKKIEELQKMRDFEIEQTEKALESYLTALDERLEKEKLTNNQATENLKEELNKRLSETLKMYSKKEKHTRENSKNEARIMENGTNNIINMLRSYEFDFRSIGERWGSALANAFNDAISSINANIPEISSYSFSSYSNGRMAQGQNITNYYNMEQTITTPVASPSRVRREIEQMMRNIKYL